MPLFDRDKVLTYYLGEEVLAYYSRDYYYYILVYYIKVVGISSRGNGSLLTKGILSLSYLIEVSQSRGFLGIGSSPTYYTPPYRNSGCR